MSLLQQISTNVGAVNVLTSTTIECSQFQLKPIPAVPSLGSTLTSSDSEGNATWTAPLADYRSYKQIAPKINLNGVTFSGPQLVVSSDGGMIVALYQLRNTVQIQFQTFLYTSGAWVLDSTITTPLSNPNNTEKIALSDGDNLLAVSNYSANEVVVYRRTAGVWVQVGAKLDLTGIDVQFGISLVINSGTQTLAVLSDSGVSFYNISASTLTPVGILSLASTQYVSLAISLDFRILVTGDPRPNNSVGQVSVYVRAALDPLTAWSLLQTVNPYSVSASAVYAAFVSLSSDGSTLAIGCPGDALNAPASVGSTGSVLMFKYVTGVGFVQGQKIVPVDYSYQSTQAINFGQDVALNSAGDTLVAGGYYDQQQLGSMWVYVRDERGLWVQNGNKYRGNDLTQANASQGTKVAIAIGNASVILSSVPKDTANNTNALLIFQ